MRIRARWVATLVIGASLLFAACSGSSSTAAHSQPSPTQPPQGVAGSTLVNPQGTMGSQMSKWASMGIKVPSTPGKKLATATSILGNDVSEWQGTATLSQYNHAFLIIREQYGTAGLDKQFVSYRDQARSLNIPRWFYHYAYPQFNDPVSEADAAINGTNWLPGEGEMLDMEEQVSDPVGWSLRYLQTVEASLHFKPTMYMNVYELYHYDWSAVAKNGNGIIVAQWNFNLTAPPTGPFPFAAGKQYSDAESAAGFSGRVDGDVFYGDATAFEKYGFQGGNVGPVPPVPTPKPTPPPTPQPTPSCIHVVQPSETLSGIVGSRWPQVAAANGIRNPNLIFVGQSINTCIGGSAPSSGCIIVQPGDTLSGLFGANWPAVARRNGIRNPNLIFVGQRIC